MAKFRPSSPVSSEKPGHGEPASGFVLCAIGGQAKIYAAHENDGPEWGLGFVATFLFPK